MPTSTKLYGTRLTALGIATAVVLTAAFALAAFYAPIEADQGFSQKIFYVHVPLAIVTLGGFVFGAICAIQYLRTGDPRHDLRSYTAIHQSLIFCIAALLTGSIWAKAAWGKTSVTARARVLNQIADRIEQNLEMLAVVETWDNGKPVRETLAADLPLTIDHFRYFAGCIRAQEGTVAELDH